MKPTSPEDRELEDAGAHVSERYRAAAGDEPPAALDAAIKAAARRDLERPRRRTSWQRPVSIAAMLVLGVSLVLVVRDNEPPLPSQERPAGEEAKLARPESPQLAMKAHPDSRAPLQREDRPSRDRSERPGREPARQAELVPGLENRSAPAASVQSVPAAPAAAGSVQPAPIVAESAESIADKKAKVGVDVAREFETDTRSLRKEEGAIRVEPNAWLGRIEGLLREGKEVEARRQLIEFRRQYPQYPLADRLQVLLPPQTAQ
jgi:hypothetical protein